jgi:PKD repeat protein
MSRESTRRTGDGDDYRLFRRGFLAVTISAAAGAGATPGSAHEPPRGDGYGTAGYGLARYTGLVPLHGAGGPPTDPDDDGVYEDVDGDGALTFADVVRLFLGLESETATHNAPAFDFSSDGRLNYRDIIELFEEL